MYLTSYSTHIHTCCNPTCESFQNPKEFELSKDLRSSVNVPGSFKETEMLAAMHQSQLHQGGGQKGMRSPSSRGKRPGSPSSSRGAGGGALPHHAAGGQLAASTSSSDMLRDQPSDDEGSSEPSARRRRLDLRCHTCSGYIWTVFHK